MDFSHLLQVCLPRRSLCALVLATTAWAPSGEAQEYPWKHVNDAQSARPLLRWERPTYSNYAHQHFANYQNHSAPYEDSPQAFYGSMGNYLISGYPLYEWREERTPGHEWTSTIFKHSGQGLGPGGPWVTSFDSMVMARDGYGGWGYSLVAGDGLIARFSPLVLSMVDLNGVRMDVAVPNLRFTGIASRIERPKLYTETPEPWAFEKFHLADDSTLLLGGRALFDLSRLQLGFSGANIHIYRSTEPGNSLKGRLRPGQPAIEWLLVRFSDDSPEDGIAGALVQEVQLVVNGEARPDLVPRVVSHQEGITPQVGRFASATGRFQPIDYTNTGGSKLFYRGRRDLPLFSDYLYRLDHDADIDISDVANIPGLLSGISVLRPGDIVRADGDGQVIYLFDMTGEQTIESVKVEALVGNDFRVDVAHLNTVNTRGRTYHQQFQSTFYRTVARSKGNVQDVGNLTRRRFSVSEDTGLFTYGSDLRLAIPGMEITAEYAGSARYGRYPALMEGENDFRAGPRSVERGSAFFVNASHWLSRGRIGGEYFRIGPSFRTEIRNYLSEAGLGNTNLQHMTNKTIYWDLVEDNDDGDRFPDKRAGNLAGFPNDASPRRDNRGSNRDDDDLDGVTLGQDADNDGFPDVNRNGDLVPDFEEPFLMYEVEPNKYVYGLDRNNNNEPDLREDDSDPDYPYDLDQKGFHLFGQVDLSRHWSLAVGHYDVEQIAGAGRNRSTYSLLTYRRLGRNWLPQLLFENNLRRVRDDIPDEYLALDVIPARSFVFTARGLRAERGGGLADTRVGPPIFGTRFVPDLVEYQDSFVNEMYLEARVMAVPGLNLHQKMRWRLNWQQGGQLRPGIFQLERRVDLWTWVSRIDYPLQLGRATVIPQYKYMLFRLHDQERDRGIEFETRSIPILRVEYPFLRRTVLRAGFQGIGPLPYRSKDRLAGRKSFEQRTAFLTVTNRSKYFGYDLVTVVGLNRDRRTFDDPAQELNEFDVWSFLVRGLIGFTEYGRPI